MNLAIYDLDATPEEGPICNLKPGEHIIGRGPLLKCEDKRVSRNHATIKISNDESSITATHQNPCFFQSTGSKTVMILDKDRAKPIVDGDKFGLFPDKFWYRIKVVKREETSELANLAESNLEDMDDSNSNDSFVFVLNSGGEASTSSNANGKENDLTIEGPWREPKMSPKSESKLDENEELIDVSGIAVNIPETTANDNVTINNHGDVKVEELSDSEDETSTENQDVNVPKISVNVPEMTENMETIVNIPETTENMETTVNIPVTTVNVLETTVNIPESTVNNSENDVNVPGTTGNNNIDNIAIHQNDGEPSSSNGTKRKYRDRCVYKDQCYRKNPAHKQDFRHPGDSDYDSDPSDDRPTCSYGAACYRRNKIHRQAYKHLSSSAPPPKQRRLRARANQRNQTSGNASSEDDYDFDDPFLDDGSEDDYAAESWSDDSDTDWRDSQDVDDADVTKTLVKEANRFTKPRRKKD